MQEFLDKYETAGTYLDPEWSWLTVNPDRGEISVCVRCGMHYRTRASQMGLATARYADPEEPGRQRHTFEPHRVGLPHRYTLSGSEYELVLVELWTGLRDVLQTARVVFRRVTEWSEAQKVEACLRSRLQDEVREGRLAEAVTGWLYEDVADMSDVCLRAPDAAWNEYGLQYGDAVSVARLPTGRVYEGTFVGIEHSAVRPDNGMMILVGEDPYTGYDYIPLRQITQVNRKPT